MSSSPVPPPVPPTAASSQLSFVAPPAPHPAAPTASASAPASNGVDAAPVVPPTTPAASGGGGGGGGGGHVVTGVPGVMLPPLVAAAYRGGPVVHAAGPSGLAAVVMGDRLVSVGPGVDKPRVVRTGGGAGAAAAAPGNARRQQRAAAAARRKKRAGRVMDKEGAIVGEAAAGASAGAGAGATPAPTRKPTLLRVKRSRTQGAPPPVLVVSSQPSQQRLLTEQLGALTAGDSPAAPAPTTAAAAGAGAGAGASAGTATAVGAGVGAGAGVSGGPSSSSSASQYVFRLVDTVKASRLSSRPFAVGLLHRLKTMRRERQASIRGDGSVRNSAEDARRARLRMAKQHLSSSRKAAKVAASRAKPRSSDSDTMKEYFRLFDVVQGAVEDAAAPAGDRPGGAAAPPGAGSGTGGRVTVNGTELQRVSAVSDDVLPTRPVVVPGRIMTPTERKMDEAVWRAFQMRDLDGVFRCASVDGGDVNYRRFAADYTTALMAAAFVGNDTVCMGLLRLGALARLETHDGRSASDFARMSGYLALADTLEAVAVAEVDGHSGHTAVSAGAASAADGDGDGDDDGVYGVYVRDESADVPGSAPHVAVEGLDDNVAGDDADPEWDDWGQSSGDESASDSEDSNREGAEGNEYPDEESSSEEDDGSNGGNVDAWYDDDRDDGDGDRDEDEDEDYSDDDGDSGDDGAGRAALEAQYLAVARGRALRPGDDATELAALRESWMQYNAVTGGEEAVADSDSDHDVC